LDEVVEAGDFVVHSYDDSTEAEHHDVFGSVVFLFSDEDVGDEVSVYEDAAVVYHEDGMPGEVKE
jgi:hypothetical protein